MGRRTTLPVLFSDLEQQAIQAAAQRVGLTPAEYVRFAALLSARAAVAEHRPKYSREQLSSIYKREQRKGTVWTETELRQRGLPLYWSEEWVRSRLAAGSSRVEMAVEAGVQEQTLTGFLRRVYGLRVFEVPTVPVSRQEQVRALYQEGQSYAEIARRLDLSEGTVRRYAVGLGREFEQRSERAFREVLGKVPDWNGTRAQIAAVAFDGNEQAATYWLRHQVREGRLERVTRGRYVIKETDPGATSGSAEFCPVS